MSVAATDDRSLTQMMNVYPTMKPSGSAAPAVRFPLPASILFAVVLLPLAAASQTLTLTNGIVTLSALSNTTVTMTGRCELRLTATNDPIPGSQVRLNSPDAWLFLLNIRPSVAAAGYLGQVSVNGAPAVSGGNVRVDQFGMGTVIIPHSPAFTPLQVFSGQNFLGTSAQLGIYTYYTDTALGAMNRNISSFKLKRGYSAAFARNVNGSGISKVFVAQDGDLEVGVLATNLDHACSFVRVFPWRWTGKKGWAGGLQPLVNPMWSYDWDNVTTSTLDAEYVPMRHNLDWNAYANINSKQKSTHALGFNEPDQANQANMSVATAIANWPNLLQSGLRVGAPAVSDSGVAGLGLDWLYDFMSQADALNYRVDFVPVHFYKCDWSATQFYNWLLGIYQQTGRPVWVTEFNNGADWCGTTPTLEQNATKISQFLDMLENAPFVERYAIFNWVGANRAMVAGDNSLTPAGVIYRDKPSALAYTQALPPGGSRSIAQFRFENNALDGSGFGNNGCAVGIPGYAPGQIGQAISLDGTNSYLQLPPNLANSAAFSFAAWVYWNGGGNWQRLFDFGDDTSHYLFLTPASGSGTLRFAIRNGGSEQIVETSGLPAGQWCHVAVTLSGNIARIYTNAVPVALSGSFTIAPSNFNPSKNYLGESQFPADPLFSGLLDEVLITDYALTGAQIAALLTNLPPQFNSNFIARPGATSGVAYSNSIAGEASDPDPGDTLTYGKAGGPAWLTVAANGTITGTPGPADGGTNSFTVRVSDAAGAGAFAILTISIPIIYSSGTWIADANGFWSETNRWSGGVVANGPSFTADFSTINPTANRVVTLDSLRSIGALKFGDTLGVQSWTIASTNDSVLRLDTASAAAPTMVVTNTATLAVSLAGTNGFAKSGPGTLVLGADNPLTGMVNIDTASTTMNEGAVRAAHPAALANVTTIQIRDNNSGSSTLQLDGSAGGITIPARLAVNCRNVAVATIQNLAGTNTFSGFIGLDVGGNLFNLQSDAGLLIFSGTNQYIGALMGSRNYAFSGAGHHLVSGPIRNSTNGAPIGLTKTGTGTLTLAAANTYTNTTTVSAGTLLVNGSLASSPVVVAGSGTLGGTGTLGRAVTVQSGGTLSPGASMGQLTVSNNVTLQPGSTTRMEISRSPLTNDVLRLTGSLNFGGTLVVTNVSDPLAAGDSFTLFQAGSFGSSFASWSLPPLEAGLAWNTSGLTNGVLSVVPGVAAYPTNLTSSVSGGMLTLAWPDTHLGWWLETNAVGLASSNTWFTLAGSTATNRVSLPIDPASSNVFYRLVRP